MYIKHVIQCLLQYNRMLQDIFALCVIQVKIQESTMTTQFSSAYRAVDKSLGNVKHHEFSNLCS